MLSASLYLSVALRPYPSLLSFVFLSSLSLSILTVTLNYVLLKSNSIVQEGRLSSVLPSKSTFSFDPSFPFLAPIKCLCMHAKVTAVQMDMSLL